MRGLTKGVWVIVGVSYLSINDSYGVNLPYGQSNVIFNQGPTIKME